MSTKTSNAPQSKEVYGFLNLRFISFKTYERLKKSNAAACNQSFNKMAKVSLTSLGKAHRLDTSQGKTNC